MPTGAQSFYDAAAQLPAEVSEPLLRVPRDAARGVTEIRLRSQRPVTLTIGGASYFLRFDGIPIRTHTNGVLTLSHAQLESCFHAVCAYSVHTFEECISQGFVPMAGGHRAGICGTALYSDQAFTVRNVTSLNIRIARTQLLRCSEAMRRMLLDPHRGLLILGAPGTGKTTLLRACLKELSDAGIRTAVVDERFELAPVTDEGFAETPPDLCDYFSGYPKHIAMLHAVRAMGPQTLVCDEIGGDEDVDAVRKAANAGVRIIATAHAPDERALRRRPALRALCETGAFQTVVLLSGEPGIGRAETIVDVDLSV